jgi:hypothetical protein
MLNDALILADEIEEFALHQQEYYPKYLLLIEVFRKY